MCKDTNSWKFTLGSLKIRLPWFVKFILLLVIFNRIFAEIVWIQSINSNVLDMLSDVKIWPLYLRDWLKNEGSSFQNQHRNFDITNKFASHFRNLNAYNLQLTQGLKAADHTQHRIYAECVLEMHEQDHIFNI